MRAFVIIVVGMLAAGCGTAGSRPAWRAPTGAPTAFLAVEHINRMGSSFVLIGLRVLVDERVVLARESEAPLPETLCVYRGSVAPGTHRIRVEARYRGHGYGVFSYLSQYRFATRGLTEVVVPPDALGVMVRSEGYERSAPTAPLEDRPQIRFLFAIERSNPSGGCFPPPGTDAVPVTQPP